MRVLILFALVFMTMTNSAKASQLGGAARMTCEDGSHIVTVSGTYFNGVEGEYTGIVLERQAVGVCVPDELLMDDAVPFNPEPDTGSGAGFSCTFELTAPGLDIVYRYVPYGIKSDGGLQVIWHYCGADMRGYALTSCVDAPFDRGTVEFMGFNGDTLMFRIVSCDADCWSQGVIGELTMEELESYCGEPAMNLVGEVLDVFGGRTYCAMLGGPYEDISRIERAPSGVCGPVPVQQVNWGGVKALYR